MQRFYPFLYALVDSGCVFHYWGCDLCQEAARERARGKWGRWLAVCHYRKLVWLTGIGRSTIDHCWCFCFWCSFQKEPFLVYVTPITMNILAVKMNKCNMIFELHFISLNVYNETVLSSFVMGLCESFLIDLSIIFVLSRFNLVFQIQIWLFFISGCMPGRK